MRQPTIAVAVLVIKDDRVLLAKRYAGKCQGTYAAPGGHLEWMETFEGAATRELEEETGLLAGPSNPEVVGVDQGFLREEDHHWVVVFVRVSEWFGEPRAVEPEKQGPWEWFPISALPENTFGPLKRILLKLSKLEVAVGALRAIRDSHSLPRRHRHGSTTLMCDEALTRIQDQEARSK